MLKQKHYRSSGAIPGCKNKDYKKDLLFKLFLLSFFIFTPSSAYSSGIGFRDFSGDITITNSFLTDNYFGIMATTTNAASAANITIDNIWVFSNDIYDSVRHGVKIDLINTGAITIENNFLDNSNASSNGRFGIRIQNHSSPYIGSNTVQNFGRSGIQLQSIDNITVVNNYLFSNGSQNVYSEIVDQEKRYYGSGLQAIDSVFTYVVSNTISSNRFAGISNYLSSGTVGPNNIIRFNGDPSHGTGGGGGMENCIVAAEGGITMRGGVLAWDLSSENDTLSVCNNTMYSNYTVDVAHKGVGHVYSCDNRVVPFFASAKDAVIYLDASSGPVDLNCYDYESSLLYSDILQDSIINAATEGPDGLPVPFGIVIIGDGSDVTVQNCTIMNAAMDKQYAATTGNNSIIGAGIFIANDATPSISNNYIFSNGWALLDDRIYTEAGASGIQMRCAEANTSIVNNIIASNANDGLVGRETGGLIGVLNEGNTFRNNGRGGIGLYDGTTRNLEIAYNTIHNNQRGIASLEFSGTMLTIANNYIHDNNNIDTDDYVRDSGGIGFLRMADGSAVVINDNIIVSNFADQAPGGISFYTTTNATVSVTNNIIRNNSYNGTIFYGMSAISGLGGKYMTGGSIYLYNNVFYKNYKSMLAGQLGVKFSTTDVKIVSNYIGGGTGQWNKYLAQFEGDAFGTKELLNSFVFSGNELDCNNRSDGPRVRYSKSITFTGNKIYNYTVLGIAISQGWVDGEPTLIERNEIYSGSYAGGFGIRMKQANDRLTIKDNTTRNGWNGIAVQNSQNRSSDEYILIASNYAYKNKGTGISLSSTHFRNDSGVTVRNNVIYSNEISGIQAKDTGYLEISSNELWSNGIGLGGLTEENKIFSNRVDMDVNHVKLDDSSSSDNDYYNKFFIYVDSGIGSPTEVEVIDYVGSTHVAKISPEWEIPPSQGDNYRIIRARDAAIRLKSSLATANVNDLNVHDNNVHDNLGIGIAFADYNSGESGTLFNNTITNNSFSGVAIGVIRDSENNGNFLIGDGSGPNTISNNGSGGSTLDSIGGGISAKRLVGDLTFSNNYIYNNIGSRAGGIGITASNATFLITGNTIQSNTGAIGGVGVTNSNGTFSFINNEIMNNIGSSENVNLRNVGGIGFNEPGDAADIYLSGNTLENNRALVTGGPTRGRVGALGFSNTNATVSMVNNTISNNDALCIGGAGFDLYGGTAYISSNVIYSNTNNKSDWGAGGLAFDEASGTITISNNRVYNNINQATGSGGIGFNDLQLSASVLVKGNDIYSNTGHKVGGMGVFDPLTSNIDIFSNTIRNNDESGLGIWGATILNIQDNLIVSNGWAKVSDGDRSFGSGIQLWDTSLVNNNIKDNTIRHNWFSGIQANNAWGSIGPNNIIRYNGEENTVSQCATSGVGGSGQGGVVVREIVTADLTVNNNTVNSNYAKDAQRKPGDCGTGYDFIYSNTVISCNGTWWDSSDAVVHISPDGVIDNSAGAVSITYPGNDTIVSGTIAGGKVWGIAILGDVDNVTIQNASIQNNCIYSPDCKVQGIDGQYVGGGVLIGGGADVYMDGNYIYSNGWSEMDLDVGLGGQVGVAMRCAGANTTLVNNIIASNANDGMEIYESTGQIGLSGGANTVRNNARFGIATRGSSENLKIVYNTVTNSKEGITSFEFEGDVLTIANNYIYNIDNTDETWRGGGVSFTLFNGNKIVIENNYIESSRMGIVFQQPQDGTVDIRNNTVTNVVRASIKFENAYFIPGGAGFDDSRPSYDLNISIENNSIANSIQKTINGMLFRDITLVNSTYIANNTFRNHKNLGVEFQRLSMSNVNIFSNYIADNWGNAGNRGGIRFRYLYEGSTVTVDNNTVVNNTPKGIEGEYLTLANVSVANNYVANNLDEGVTFRWNSLSNITIDNNNIYNNNTFGIGLDENNLCDFKISGNMVNNQDESGLQFRDNTLTKITVSNNSIINNCTDGGGSLAGIRLIDNHNMDKITIYNNFIDNNVRGLEAQGSDHIYFTGNTISNGAGVSIAMQDVYSVWIGPEDSFMTSTMAERVYNHYGVYRPDQETDGQGRKVGTYARDILFPEIMSNGGNYLPGNNGVGLMVQNESISSTEVTARGLIVDVTTYGYGIQVKNGARAFITESFISGANGGKNVAVHLGGQATFDNSFSFRWKTLSAEDSGSQLSITNGSFVWLLLQTRDYAKGYVINDNTVGCLGACSQLLTPGVGANSRYYLYDNNRITGGIHVAYYGILYMSANNRVFPGSGFEMHKGGQLTLVDGNTIENRSFQLHGASASITINGNPRPNTLKNFEMKSYSGTYNFYNGNYFEGMLIKCGEENPCSLTLGENTFNNSTVQIKANSFGGGHGTTPTLVYSNLFTNFGTEALKIQYAYGSIRNNKITGGAYGVSLDNVWGDMVIEGNYIEDISSEAIKMDGGQSSVTMTFKDNTLTNNPARGISVKGLGSFVCQDNLFEDGQEGFRAQIDGDVIGNTFRNLTGRGFGFGNTGGGVDVSNSTIKSNYFENISGSGVDGFDHGLGLGFTNVTANETSIYNNVFSGGDQAIGISDYEGDVIGTMYIGDGTGAGKNIFKNNDGRGVGVNDVSANLVIDTNDFYSNDDNALAFLNASGAIDVQNNLISLNNRSGIAFSFANAVTLQANIIVSNGFGEYENPYGYPDASGIQAKESTFINISGNTISNNVFAGIAAFSTDGYIGPDNTFSNNGDITANFLCNDLDGPGSGYGAITVRDLQDAVVSSTLIVSNNVIEDTNISTIAWKDCKGTIRLDGADWAKCGGDSAFDSSDAIVYVKPNGDILVNGTSVANSTVVDCGTTPGVPQNINGGDPWGIIVAGGASGISIKNCTIYNSNTVCNTRGPDNTNLGGGLLIGPFTDVLVYSNEIYNNGCAGFGGPPLGEGGSAGVVMRCANDGVTLKNNLIHDNDGDGIDINGGSPTVGVAGAPNDIYNNGRHGVGCAGETSAILAYNTIHDNMRVGIGTQDDSTVTIRNNSIYNHKEDYHKSAGVGIIDMSSPYVYSNYFYGNEHGIGFGKGETIREDTLPSQGIQINEIRLDALASDTDDAYNGMLLSLGESSVGSPNSAQILDYDSANKVATLTYDWDIIPSINDLYSIMAVGYSGTALIEKNSIFNEEQGGIGIWGSDNAQITIDNNTINSIGGAGEPSGIGMRYDYGSTIYIINNPSIANSRNGIEGKFNIGTNIIIDNNAYIADNSFGAVAFEDNYNLTLSISNNIIHSNWRSIKMRWNRGGGIEIINNSITNTYNTAGAGVMLLDHSLDASEPLLEYLTINSNYIADSGRSGIMMRDITFNNSDLTINNNTIIGNGDLGIGIDYSSIRNLVIISNMVSSNTNNGIGVEYSSIAKIEQGDNTVINNADATLQDGGIAMRSIVELVDVVIYSNYIDNNNSHGMAMRSLSGATSISIRNNSISNSTRAGIAMQDHSGSLEMLYIGENYIFSNLCSNNERAALIIENHTLNDAINVNNNTFRNQRRALSIRGNVSGDVNITNNLIASHSESGFGLGNNSLTVDTLLISANTVRNNGGSAITSGLPGGIGLAGSLDANTIKISGNTILNNVGTGVSERVGGLGIWRVNGADITVSNNKIGFNAASGNDMPGGLGFWGANSTILIADNEIYSNTGADDSAGGIGIINQGDTIGTYTFERNIIRHNSTAGTGGGGVGIWFDSSAAAPVFRNNMIYRNSPSGIKISRTVGRWVDILHNTIAYNAQYGIDNACTYAGAFATITNNILWGNGDDLSASGGYGEFAATYSDIEDGDAGSGNISSDPNFVNAAADNFHIGNSYAVDGGTIVNVSDDFDGDSRPAGVGNGYDMGADECPSCTQPPPVLNSITLTDLDDLNNPDAEFTNETIVNVTLSVSDNPTDMMLCEDSGFSGCSWVGSYASPTTFTFANQTNGSKTVYATIKNIYGGSGTENDSITFDNVSPGIQTDTLTAPDGGESWTVSDEEAITWTYSDITDDNLKSSPISLSYNTNSGSGAYTSITTDLSNSGIYSWTVADDANSTVRVKIAAYDKAGNESSDASDADFTITGGGSGGCSTPDVCSSTCTYSTISSALAVIDTVCVGDGTYTENIVIGDSRTVTITSVNGKDNTTIDADTGAGAPRRIFVIGNSTVTIDGFYLRDGYATNSGDQLGGAAIKISGGGDVTVNNSSFYNNVAGNRKGGAIFANSSSTVTMQDCLVQSNSAQYGGAVGAEGSGQISINDTIFDNCSAAERGNVLWINVPTGDTTITGSEMKNSPQSNSFGGAIYWYTSNASRTLSISETLLYNNRANQMGAAIYFYGGNLQLYHDVFDTNYTGQNGTVYMQNYSTSSIDRCTFSNNDVAYGGAMFLTGDNTTIDITNSLFENNKADNNYGRGGALYFNSSTGVTNNITNCTFADNYCDGEGCGIYAKGTTTIKNCILWGNYGGQSLKNQIADYGTTNVYYTDIQNGCSSSSCDSYSDLITSDPDFTADYHLNSSSPCKDTGDSVSIPDKDIDGQTRPYNGVWDMGSDEYVP